MERLHHYWFLTESSSCCSSSRVGSEHFSSAMAGRESALPSLFMSCHIQLICQCSGLFLERPELAARNQDAINLRLHKQDAGETLWSGGSWERQPSRFVCWWRCSHENRYSISSSSVAVCCQGKHLTKKICFWNFTSTFGVLLLPSTAVLGGRKAGFSTFLAAWIRKRTQPTLYRYPHIPFCVYFGRCWIGVSFRTTLSLRQPSWLHSEFYKSSFSGKLSKPQCPFESCCMTVQKTKQ